MSEEHIIQRSHRIIGVDEAGRGPLAGPVVAAAVILPIRYTIPDLKDSKQLSQKKRETCFNLILEQALGVSVGRAEHWEIDLYNILKASLLAMRRAMIDLLNQLSADRGDVGLFDQILVDGPQIPDLEGIAQRRLINRMVQGIIGGDRLYPAISAASIIAKVTRDREMCLFDRQYPEYGFLKHKGYPTAAHRQALRQHGPCAIHRLSFGPVAQVQR
jgi:ribonuclease HII